MNHQISSRGTIEKALRINLDENKYGSIAEIGAGQEVARQFFLAGAAAGTIAKTISAYDMQFSDAIYGVQESGRYVSRARVLAMLEKEYDLVLARVGTSRPKASRFFAYATTVAAKAYNRDNECHAWCGIRLQTYPQAEASQIIVHLRMRDNTAEYQQDALGVFGVNLIYAAYYYFESPKKIIDSLSDGLDSDRIEIDSIEFSGPYFEEVDNRAINLHLIRSWKTRAVLFRPDGSVGVPAEMLYKKNVLAIRGSFRPITRLNVDMIEQGFAAFTQRDGVSAENTLMLAEITLNDGRGKDLMEPEEDIINRVVLLNSLGYSVMVSDYTRYFSLRAYFRQFTKLHISIVLGIINLRTIFNEDTYQGVEGGILEGFGKLFPDNTRLLVYPEVNHKGDLVDYQTISIPDQYKYLYKHLLENEFIFGLESGDKDLFKIFARDIANQIANRKEGWEKAVPEGIAELIIEKRMFGYK